jgi:hypothetical protein
LPNTEEKKYIFDKSPDYDFGEVRLLAPVPFLKVLFGPVEDTPDDDDDDESLSSGRARIDKGAGFKGFISSVRLNRILKRVKPRPPKCFQCAAELIGPFCFVCGIKFTGEEKVFRRV